MNDYAEPLYDELREAWHTLHTAHIEIQGVVIDEPPTAFQLGRVAEVKEAANE